MTPDTGTNLSATGTASDLFQSLGRAGLTGPYDVYRHLRKRNPIHRTREGLWVLTRYADVAAVLRDPRFGRGFERHFGSVDGTGANGTGHRQSMLFRDPRITRGSATR